jgi:hypothetical protein
MPNRILLLVSAVLVNLVLSILVLPVLPDVARAADDCLTSPNKATPAGDHWRYHLERGTGRKCWYLANEIATDNAAKPDAAKPDADDPDTTASVPPKPAVKIAPSIERAAAVPPDRPRAAKPVPTPSPPATFGQANNARAEFIDAPRSDQPAAAAPAATDAPLTAAPDATPQQGSVSTHWPNPGSVPAADNNALPATNSAPAPSAQPAADAPPAADQPAQDAPAVQAVASAQPADAAEGPDYLLYALIIFASSFAVVATFAGVRFLTDWWRDWREEARWRQSQQTYAAYRERSMLAMDEVPMGLAPANAAPMPWTGSQRAQKPKELPEELPRRLEDEIDEIELLLALTRQIPVPAQPPMWDAHSARDAAE